MKAVIFAGGVGTRLWPLSRKKSPKQFEKIIGEKSTLQIAVERLLPEFRPDDIYISTGLSYVDIVKSQLAIIPAENIIGEPEMKDVGPAVCYMMGYLSKRFPNDSVVILWSDHLVRNEEKFKKILLAADKMIKNNPEKIVFIGQQPRFASDNLGWIEMGDTVKRDGAIEFKKFAGFKYRPDRNLAEKYFHNNKYCWNLGYFVSTPKFVYSLFKKYAPEVYGLTEKIHSFSGNANFLDEFASHYSKMPKINFDNAVLEQLDRNSAYVVVDDIGWSDVGAWEALKEALAERSEDNITKGKVFLEDSVDNLVYNYDGSKLIVGIDIDDHLIVNTSDVLLIAKKSSVSKIKQLVESFKGTENEVLT